MVLTPVGQISESEMNGISNHYSNVLVDRHVIMPNDVHALIVIEGNHQFCPGATFTSNAPRPEAGPLA